MKPTTYGAQITIEPALRWSPEDHEAMQRFRDFFWPPGHEDSGEALQRRAALAADTYLAGLVNVLRDLDDQVLHSVLTLSSVPNAFMKAFAALILLKESHMTPVMDDMARELLLTTPPEGLVASMEEFYEDVGDEVPDEYLDCVRMSHGLVRP